MPTINISHSLTPYINFCNYWKSFWVLFQIHTLPIPSICNADLSKMQFSLFFPYSYYPSMISHNLSIKFKFHRMAFKGHPYLALAISSASCLGTLPLICLIVPCFSYSGFLQDPASPAHITLFAGKLFPFLSLLWSLYFCIDFIYILVSK